MALPDTGTASQVLLSSREPKSDKKSAIEAMPHKYNPELVRNKMLKAEEALRQYFELFKRDAVKEKELMAAVELARNEFVDQFEMLFPQI